MTSRIALLGLAAVMCACGGTTEDPVAGADGGALTSNDAGQDPDAGTTMNDAGEEISFERDVKPILVGNCTGYCHPGSYAPMPLQDGNAWENLVDVPSVGCGDGRLRVKPGDPSTTNSYLMAKLTGTDLCGGNVMPPSGQLPAESIETLRAWIEAGAPNN